MNAFDFGFGWMGSKVLRCVVTLRNRRFDKGKRVHDVGVPVISVGNISIGGTGKTPMVRWIVQELQALGAAPAIALRGYKARDGVSDEAVEHEAALPGVPVLVGANRVQMIKAAIAGGLAIDCVVLDDGFQHRFVHRNLDIVLIDARRPPDTDRMLPLGRLREPAIGLGRADAIVVTHADHAAASLTDRLAAVHGAAPIGSCVHAWSGVRRIECEQESIVDVDVLQGLRVVTRLAIAGPKGVQRMLEEHGAEVVGAVPARDHQAATMRDLDELAAKAANADAIVVCAKDMATMGPLLEQRALPVPVLVPQLELRFLNGAAALRDRIATCVARDAT